MSTLIFRISMPSLVIALLTCLGNATLAQHSSFITSISPHDIPVTQEMDAYVGRLKKHPDLAAYHFVKLNPLASSQKDGVLQLDIPGRSKPVIASASHVEYYSENEYEWIGNTDEGRGTVIVICKSGRVSAHISTPDGVYEIFPAPAELYCLQIIDPADVDNVGCVAGEKAKPVPEIPTDPKRTGFTEIQGHLAPTNRNAKLNPCQAVPSPRVLVLYTAKTLTYSGGINVLTEQTNLAIAQYNAAIYNSGITSGAVITLAGIEPLNFLEKEKLGEDLESLIANPTAQNLRNQYQADLVVLFTDGYYSGGNTRGGTQNPDLLNNLSYSIVEFWCSTSRKTFAHEVGHLFGCRHDDDNTSQPTYAKGYNIKNGLGITVDRTLMVGKDIKDNEAKNRLINFSNPNIQVGGKATGTVNENNALRIKQTYSTVANFRPNAAPPLVAYVDGPTYVTSPGQKTYEVSYSCGSGSYNVVWHYSYDGVNYTASNTITDIFTWPFYQNQKI